MKILVVEDDPQIANSLRLGLETAGFQVVLESNGQDALRVNRLTEPDILLVDVMLPGMSGIELVSKLRQLEVNTPILMLTARSAIPDRVMGLEAGADDYLSKPFAMAELIARIRALLRREVKHRASIIREMTLKWISSAKS